MPYHSNAKFMASRLISRKNACQSKRARCPGGQQIAQAKKPGMHAVGGVDGLLLQVTKTGATSWMLRAMIAGKRRGMGLGSYPAVGVAAAREKARAARQQIEEGLDPIERRQPSSARKRCKSRKYENLRPVCKIDAGGEGLGWKTTNIVRSGPPRFRPTPARSWAACP